MSKVLTAAAPAFAIERQTRASRFGAVALVLALLVMVSMPWWGGRAEMRTLTEFLYILALAQMWNLLAGYGGLVSVGQQAFIGLGGYALVVFAMKLGLNVFVSVFLSGLVAAVIAIPTAAVVFRLRGAYFAIGTWVVAEIFRLLIANTVWLGGGSGLSITSAVKGIPAWWRESITFWLAIAIGLGAVLLSYLLLRSRHGLALTAVRDSEAASESLGVRVRDMKWFVYVASAFGCGLVGGLIFITKLRISPDAAFSADWTAIMFFVVVIGGIGTIEGPIVGALVYFALRGTLQDFGSWYLIVLGLVAVVLMLKMPKGIWGWVAARHDIRFFPVQRRLRLTETGKGGRR
ncbi:MAG: branched-chain amino acid ABC transporter permease [Hyphomicrobiales bacterium]